MISRTLEGGQTQQWQSRDCGQLGSKKSPLLSMWTKVMASLLPAEIVPHLTVWQVEHRRPGVRCLASVHHGVSLQLLYLLTTYGKGRPFCEDFFSAFYLSWDYMHFRWASRVLEWVCLVLELIRCRDSRLIMGLSCSFMRWEQPDLCPPPQRPAKVHSPCPNLNCTEGGGKRMQRVHPSSIWTRIPQLYDWSVTEPSS